MTKIQNPKVAKKTDDNSPDVVNQHSGESWYYSDIVKDHFFNPRNFLVKEPENESEYDTVGLVGAAACGDMMKMWLKIEIKTERIKELKWKTFGCASAIAATSMFSVMATENGGLTIAQALEIKPQGIIKRLGGLPDRKIHCSVLADKAFRKAVNDYFHRTKQYERVMIENGHVVDQKLNITDKDIEEAVLEGARSVREVQMKLKVGAGDPEAIPAIEQLIRFYCDKYYG
jgi:NifU-like protein involved in Fe-S cluster formation